jgi:hypothetical protein
VVRRKMRQQSEKQKMMLAKNVSFVYQRQETLSLCHVDIYVYVENAGSKFNRRDTLAQFAEEQLDH